MKINRKFVFRVRSRAEDDFVRQEATTQINTTLRKGGLRTPYKGVLLAASKGAITRLSLRSSHRAIIACRP
jgi:cytochrome c biogenesis protein ResB